MDNQPENKPIEIESIEAMPEEVVEVTKEIETTE